MGELFFTRLKEEGRLQKGDEVMVDGEPAVVNSIRSTSEIVVDYRDGCRAVLSGLESGKTAVLRPVSLGV